METQFRSIGDVLKHIGSVANLDEKAQIMQDFIERENLGSGYDHGRYLEFGSLTHTTVIQDPSGSKKECILWCINHYLSLNRNETVIQKACEALHTYGTGCGTSAPSCGMNTLHKQVEKRIIKLLGREDAVLFPTGFTTNLGVISRLASEKDLIIIDRECHSSIINGVRLSNAKWIPFKHNDVKDLENKLKRYEDKYENIFVVVESAYSMSGDLSPLKEIVKLKKSNKFYLYVDEAHTFGIYGDKGQGYCYDQGVTDEVDFIISTLSKATASIGGFFSAKKEYCSLIRWSDLYVFQACLTPADAAVILASLDEIEANPSMITELHNKNKYMRSLLISKGFNLGKSESPIIPIMINDMVKLKIIVDELYQNGIYSTPVIFPAVKITDGRIRLIVNLSHTKEQIDYTVKMLENICKKHQVI